MKNFCTAFLLTAMICSGNLAFAFNSEPVNSVSSGSVRIAQVPGNEKNLITKKGIINSSMTKQEKQQALLKLLKEYDYDLTSIIISYIDWDKVTDDFAPSFYTAVANKNLELLYALDGRDSEMLSDFGGRAKIAAHNERYMQRFNIFCKDFMKFEKLGDYFGSLYFDEQAGYFDIIVSNILNSVITNPDITDEQIMYEYLKLLKVHNIKKVEFYKNYAKQTGAELYYKPQTALRFYNEFHNEALSILKYSK